MKERADRMLSNLVRTNTNHLNAAQVAHYFDTVKTFNTVKPSDASIEKPLGFVEGINTVKQLEYKDKIGWVKDEESESVLDKDGDIYHWSVVENAYLLQMDSEGGPLRLDDRAARDAHQVIASPEYQNEHARIIAELAGLPEAQREAFIQKILGSEDRMFTSRIDVPAGLMAPREAVMSSVGMLLGYKEIPPTAMRVQSKLVIHESEGSRVAYNVASIQENVPVTDKERPPRALSSKEIEALMKQPSEKWQSVLPGCNVENLKKSFARLAALDWLMGSLDRHRENMLVDPVSGDIHGIDNGLCAPRGRTQEGGIARVNTAKERGRLKDPGLVSRQMRSVALEVVFSQQDIVLDPKDRVAMASLLGRLQKGLEAKSPEDIGAAEHYALEDAFKLMFPDHLLEALTQMQGFKKRLEYLAKYGRPPEESLKNDVFHAESEQAMMRSMRASQTA